MNDDLYKSIQSRLLADKLIGQSVAAFKERCFERDFQYWQNTTNEPAEINKYVNNLGK